MTMNFKNPFTIGVALLMLCGLCTISCSDQSELDMCTNRLYYVSSAVCTDSDLDAAVRDFSGQTYIAQNLFDYVDRADMTIDKKFTANYRLIQAADPRAECGGLIVAPVIEIMCLEPLN